MRRAVQLASHDIGIGALIYLRRVFESLVEDAHQIAQRETGWNEEEWQSARMSDKIKLLAGHLPEFLRSHPEMYSILSVGVHALTEGECLRHFPALKTATELILDQKLEDKVRAERAQAARAAIARIHGGLKS